MGGSRVIWDSLLRQCNAVSVDSIPAMADTALAFSHLPWRRYRGISIVGGGGALGVAAADAADAYGMELPALAEGIREGSWRFFRNRAQARRTHRRGKPLRVRGSDKGRFTARLA